MRLWVSIVIERHWRSIKRVRNMRSKLRLQNLTWIMLIGDWGRVVSTYLYPYKEDVMRFDFEVDEEDEVMVGILPMLAGKILRWVVLWRRKPWSLGLNVVLPLANSPRFFWIFLKASNPICWTSSRAFNRVLAKNIEHLLRHHCACLWWVLHFIWQENRLLLYYVADVIS